MEIQIKKTNKGTKHEYKFIKLFSNKFFIYYSRKDSGWFRLFGRGLSWKDLRVHSLNFSERYGYVKYLKLGNYAIRKLKK